MRSLSILAALLALPLPAPACQPVRSLVREVAERAKERVCLNRALVRPGVVFGKGGCK